jgi:hypothetical protein
MGDSGAKALAKALPLLQSLEVLYLCNCVIQIKTTFQIWGPLIYQKQ